jgi:hypothetical protein
VAATRFLSTARGDTKKAIDMMDAAQKWRSEFFKKGPIIDESVAADFQEGIIYFAGRDIMLRPTIVVRANRVPDTWYKEKSTERLLKILIFAVEYMVRYMCIPGKIESNCLIVDLKGLGASQVPFKELKEIYSVMSHFYPGRLSRVYICNLSSVLSMGMSAVKGLLTDRQKQKIVYIKDVSEFLTHFAAHQVETDLGGSQPIHKSFFPFPISAGPYDASCTTGADENAIKNLHEVFDLSDIQGRLWDVRKNEKMNTFLMYSDDAVEIFQRNNLPVPEDASNPPHLDPTQPAHEEEEEQDAHDDADAFEEDDAANRSACQRCFAWCKALFCRQQPPSSEAYQKLA